MAKPNKTARMWLQELFGASLKPISEKLDADEFTALQNGVTKLMAKEDTATEDDEDSEKEESETDESGEEKKETKAETVAAAATVENGGVVEAPAPVDAAEHAKVVAQVAELTGKLKATETERDVYKGHYQNAVKAGVVLPGEDATSRKADNAQLDSGTAAAMAEWKRKNPGK